MSKPTEGETTTDEAVASAPVTDPVDESPEEEFADWDEGVSFENTEDDSEDQETSDEAVEEPEPTEEESNDDEKPEEEAEEVSSEESEESEEEDTASKDVPSKEEQKRLNDEAAKRRIAERKLRDEREARQKEQLQRYLDDAKGDEDELAKRQLDVERFNLQEERIAFNTQRLERAIDQAAREIDLLRSPDPVVQNAFRKAIDAFEAMHVVKDKHGRPLEVKEDVYQFLKTEAESIRELTGIGAREQAKHKSNEKAKTVLRPSRTPKEKPVDPDFADFDEMAKRDW